MTSLLVIDSTGLDALIDTLEEDLSAHEARRGVPTKAEAQAEKCH